MANSTPLLERYRALKGQNPDRPLLVRLGDFYEAFDADAQTIARVLGLALTQRQAGADAVAIAGFPCFHLHPYMTKLAAAGLNVRVVERLSNGPAGRSDASMGVLGGSCGFLWAVVGNRGAKSEIPGRPGPDNRFASRNSYLSWFDFPKIAQNAA